MWSDVIEITYETQEGFNFYKGKFCKMKFVLTKKMFVEIELVGLNIRSISYKNK